VQSSLDISTVTHCHPVFTKLYFVLFLGPFPLQYQLTVPMHLGHWLFPGHCFCGICICDITIPIVQLQLPSLSRGEINTWGWGSSTRLFCSQEWICSSPGFSWTRGDLVFHLTWKGSLSFVAGRLSLFIPVPEI